MRSAAAALLLLQLALLGRQTHGLAQVIGAGNTHACALLEGAALKCWGSSTNGQLGQGIAFANIGDQPGSMEALQPIDLGSGHSAVAVALGATHTCAVLENASLKCWGRGLWGRLGYGDQDNRGDAESEMGDDLPFVDLGTGRTVTSIALGAAHSCAILDNQSLKCWGRNNDGQLGQESGVDRGDNTGEMGDNLQATLLGDGFTPIAVTAGDTHTCALSTAGRVKCWGGNSRGQLGLGEDSVRRGTTPGSLGNSLPPVNLGENAFVVAISAGGFHTCALLVSGAVKCWGFNQCGQLGYGDSRNRGSDPGEMGDDLPTVDLGSNRTAVAISCGTDFSCALLDNGDVKCWGDNSSGQLGQGDADWRGNDPGEMGDSLLPINLGAGREAVAIGTGSLFAMALFDDGSVKCWGSNSNGQLGLDDDTPRGDQVDQMGDNLPSAYLGEDAVVPFCDLGEFREVSCAACPAGRWGLAGASSSDECVACDLGKYSLAGSTQCVKCPAGTFASMRGTETCQQCTAGTYSDAIGATNSDICVACPATTYSPIFGAVSPETCLSCEPGTYGDMHGLPTCLACQPGKYSTEAQQACVDCPAGKYSVLDGCVSCPAGLASNQGSAKPSDCQSPTTSFAVAGVLFCITLVILGIYVCFGRARRVAFLEQQISTPILVQACTAASATILLGLRRQRTSNLLGKLVLLAVTFVALVVTTTIWFITNTFLLSTSFSPPNWLDQFEDELSAFIDAVPLLWFLVIVPPVMRWISAIDFTFLMTGVQVTCLGAQGPALLFGTTLIVVATVLVIDSQFHAMLALAFVPMTSLVQIELLSVSALTWSAKIRNFLKFAVLALASAVMMSFSRYVMQVFTTLVEYSSFLPYREFSKACNDDKIDSTLAITSTVVFYASMLPVAMLMVRVLMPGLPASIRFSLPETRMKLAKSGQYRKTKTCLDWLNPLKWAMRALYSLMLKLVAMSSAGRATIATDLAPTLRDRVQAVNRDEVKLRWEQLRHEELPDLLELLRLIRSQSKADAKQTLWHALCVCAWKLKLALLVVLGVWTDEVATAMQIEPITHQYYGWTRDPKLLHEDVMGVIGSMRSMTWMLLPPLIVLTKMAEVTNNPAVFVLTDKLHMTSPLIFRSWSDAEAVMLEGKTLLDAIHKRAEKAAANRATRRRSVLSGQQEEQTANDNMLEARLEHLLCVALVWVLGARLPRYAVQMTLLALTISMAIDPHMEVLLAAVFIIMLWSLIYTFAILLDVRLMLRLRKEQPAVSAQALGEQSAAVVAEVNGNANNDENEDDENGYGPEIVPVQSEIELVATVEPCAEYELSKRAVNDLL